MNMAPSNNLDATIGLLKTVDLTLSYGQSFAFKNINLTIGKGQVTAIVGPSGCGKSSFLQSLNRLTDNIPACKVSGVINFHEINICEKRVSVQMLRRKVGMILQ